jgi:hypothetical protein
VPSPQVSGDDVLQVFDVLRGVAETSDGWGRGRRCRMAVPH